MDFETYNNLVESTLGFLGLNPVEARSEEKGQWLVFNGDTEIYIDLWEQKQQSAWLYFESDQPVYIFQVISPICYLPTANVDQLYEELLHNNLNMLYGSYTINKEENVLAVKFRRICNGLKQEDIVEAIESIGYYSESTFKALNDRYDISKIEVEEE